MTKTLEKTGLKPVRTGTRKFALEPEGHWKTDVCEVRARVEFRKDARAWALAMARNPFVIAWSSDDYYVSATFVMDVAEEGLKQLESDIIDIYYQSETLFRESGVEPHVLVESLKTADQFDGARNGPLAEFRIYE
jgi:hypothetical protein